MAIIHSSMRDSLAYARRLRGLACRPLAVSLVAIVCLFGVMRVQAQETTTVTVAANAEWLDTGVDVHTGAAYLLSITAAGKWTNAGGGPLVGPAGYGSYTLPNAAAPTLPFASLLGRVNGTIFAIGERLSKPAPGTGRLFLAMNDVPGTYGDNSGQLTVVVTQSTNPAVFEFKDPLLSLELLSPDPLPFYTAPSFSWSIKNRVHPPISGEIHVLLDGALSSTNPAPWISNLAAGAEQSGTFTLFTGASPHLDAGQHEVRMELRAFTPDHTLLGTTQAYVTAFVPSTPAEISIAEFKIDPDYQNQGSSSKLSWTLQPTATCVPADLRITKKDVGKPDDTVLEVGSPATMGAKNVVVAGGSSPLRYALSVACKFCSSCQTLGPTTVTAERQLWFAPLPPPMQPILDVNGPFFTPVQVKTKQSFSVSWTFANAGGAPLDAFDVELFVDDIQEGGSVTVPKLNAGTDSSKSWTITRELASGIHKLELKKSGGSISFSQFEVLP